MKPALNLNVSNQVFNSPKRNVEKVSSASRLETSKGSCLVWFYPLFARWSVNLTGVFQCTACRRRGTHLSLHLLKKMPLLSGYSLLQGPLSVRAHITYSYEDICSLWWAPAKIFQSECHQGCWEYLTCVSCNTHRALSLSSPWDQQKCHSFPLMTRTGNILNRVFL